MTAAERRYQDNLLLGKTEYQLQRIHLQSRPRALGLVLSNRCNIGCIHCYQAKNADALFAPAEIGRDLRRELAGFYPYLSTLDLQGGEVFLSPGFAELVDEVAASVERPIMRITTNGTLIDEHWAERIVRTPFQCLTVSIDGGTAQTYRKLRLGAELDNVLGGIRRIQSWKAKLGGTYPYLDSFYVVMRSNFREIPQYLQLMRDEGVPEVAFETVRITAENMQRHPDLVQEEVISDPAEAAELHSILTEALAAGRRHFHAIRVSGLTTLFSAHGLDTAFLHEDTEGLYPETGDLRPDEGGLDLCPNPWMTMFITESGNVHLCFLSEPIGNLYQAPIAEIWNSPEALAKRSRMAAGRYLESKCSKPSCSWREGRKPQPTQGEALRQLLADMKELSRRAEQSGGEEESPELPALSSVRRMMREGQRSVTEIETLLRELCDTNASIHAHGQAYIDRLESELKASTAAARNSRLVQISVKAAHLLNRFNKD